MIATESFLPHVNGVTNSVLRVLEYFEQRGVEALVVAPGRRGPSSYAGSRVVRLASAAMPGYPEVRLSVAATGSFQRLIQQWQPDIVHVASPFVHGSYALTAAARLEVPAVAVFQTDIAGFARHYRLGAAETLAWQRIRAIHRRADLTLAPSSAAARDLVVHGIVPVELWPRGVDTKRFSPRWRSEALRRRLAPDGEVLVGYVGRLAAEKQVQDLGALADLPNTRLVVVGDGPLRETLRRTLPDAVFLGFCGGDTLSATFASLDVFVHPGESETFCQAAQESLASAVPVVAVGSGGLTDLVDPSRNGWLYPPGDLGALHSHVADLVGDDFKRRAMGAAARAGVRRRSWSAVGDALLGHYDAVLARRVASRSTSAVPASSTALAGGRRRARRGNPL